MTDKGRERDREWRARLSSLQYHVTRERGVEEPFSGAYLDTTTPGVYVCVCCGQPLFASAAKFDSGSGWPSFYAPVESGAVATRTDTRFGKLRTELLCSRCDAHLGHVYRDGRQPTGAHYCVNSAALHLEPEKA